MTLISMDVVGDEVSESRLLDGRESESFLLEDALELSDSSLVLISCKCSPPSDPVGLLVTEP